VVRHGAGQAGGHLVAGSPQWSDYSVSVDVSTALLDLGSAGVAGRYQGPGADYECVVNVGGQLELWVAQGGQRRLLGASTISLDLTGRHTIGLEMRGSRLVCSLDGAPLLRATDATYAAGRIALVASTGEAAEFGDVRDSS
jgi:pectate lyase